MTRRCRTPWLPALLLFGLVTGAPVRAENPDWGNVAKTFGEQFKIKSDVSLKQRRSAVNTLAKSKDGRAVDLLLTVVADQARFAGKLRKEWEEGEAAWQARTVKSDALREERAKEARERGEKVKLPAEVLEWLGDGKEKVGTMVEAKRQLGKQYGVLLEEEGLVRGILRGISRVLNSIEGAELTKASTKATGAATAAKGDLRLAFVKGMGYAKGETITAFLETAAKDANTEVAQVALESLGRQNGARGADILISRLDDARWQARAAAITGLSFYRNGKVVGKVMDALLERAKREEGVLQRNFFVAMARIVQEAVPATVEAWESWWKANREAFTAKLTARDEDGLPIEDDPEDMLVDTHQGSSSFYGITTTSKHIIYVVDISGSMNADAKTGKKSEDPNDKRRIDIAREELKKAVLSLSSKEEDERGEASFNIVIFASETEVYKPGKMIDVTKQAKEEALEWVEKKIQPTTHTNIYDAIEQAFNLISATSDAKNLQKGADTIFLMTDGVPDRGKFCDKDLILSEVKRLNETRKITLHAIGVGKGHDATFLQKLAAANGGQYVGR